MTTLPGPERAKELAGKLQFPDGLTDVDVMDIWQIISAYPALVEENERLKQAAIDWQDAYNRVNGANTDLLVERAEKAEAENETNSIELAHATERANSLEDKWRAAEAELARWRPLIEAVEAKGDFSVAGETSMVAHRIIQEVQNLRVTLAAKEEK